MRCKSPSCWRRRGSSEGGTDAAAGGGRVRIVVQKFGGSSVVTPRQRQQVAARVQEALADGLHVVVVVSAMGRAGDPYSTDTLLGLLQGGAEPDARERDLLAACGEIVAAVVLAHELRASGLPAVALTGWEAGIITDANFGSARVLKVKPDLVLHYLRQGRVVVVAGFQGVTEDGQVTTLGRGGSDTTAAVLGAALGAEWIDIFTDVPGVYTADPRLVPDAAMLERLTFREVVEMAHSGAKVVHPRAVEIAMEHRIPLRIRPANGTGLGTFVAGPPAHDRLEFHVQLDRVVTGIASVPERTLFRLPALDAGGIGRRTLNLFESLGARKVSIDMIDVSESGIGFVVAREDRTKTERLLGELGVDYEVRDGLTKVSVVGSGMHGVPGVMARVARALHAAGAAVYGTTDSHANIACLVRTEDAARVVRALHDEFALGADQEQRQEATVDEAGKLVDRHDHTFSGRRKLGYGTSRSAGASSGGDRQ